MARSCLSIVLAAGEGTRMKSSLPKVLHEVAGLPMVAHVLRAAELAGATRLAVVVGREAERIAAVASRHGRDASVFEQTERLGTAHAVLAARDAIEEGFDDILVLFGDTPLIRPETLTRARAALMAGADICVIGFRPPDPTGYGRLIEHEGSLVAIREEKDASDAERMIRFCNGGVMAFRGEGALDLLDRIGNANAKGEYYLTDIVEIARAAGRTAKAIEADPDEVLGVNNRVELAGVEAIWQARRRREVMLGGATLQAPDTVFFSHDTVLEPDCTIEPNVVFGPGAQVAGGAVVHAFSHIAGATIGEGASVGPFARLRPGADLARGAKVGNFCEVKGAIIGEGAKVNHLTYIGDAVVGAGSNIGAGTITCNYDGFNKHRTVIGENVFVGSNSALVAPVSIGDGAYVASGSVVTEDVPPEALAIARGRQVNKDGRGRAINERNKAAKVAAKAAKAED
ncbi:bifunctional UDP-N-acetylglucosamine diphosphorylase/glucosamine-1-phosphate N-acetyltransferase GlmU [Antarcticirhabdus aurantiaca]|uniref:Bifunctional UDP-N-acetylglucosamine diphosphorylase/glucosamine-1-phosphate N-acetyltransferase GlmU n=1 Tax=Antarcticirhabdus aurantiaca TaxID=2606717 RepID=A0ACD4NW37_9HYPH|nr:bifunctional UDP-N-acetylglucosamine diphosphorylase/glucosamine-1-phosphate N-acetyltransferase GlmU [Antarcticirhabdus aurantiaca]WAJ30939.1 bifunctional UDP-N-acetylglucosamine diphosphorylase/glucosamine-1-phosphate N-acetyltransferase GlmU [Jeongeuplla avenae]